MTDDEIGEVLELSAKTVATRLGQGAHPADVFSISLTSSLRGHGAR